MIDETKLHPEVELEHIDDGTYDLKTDAMDEYTRQLEHARREGFLAGLFFATSFMESERE